MLSRPWIKGTPQRAYTILVKMLPLIGYIYAAPVRFFWRGVIGRRSSSEVILDADDRALGSRGAILDVEGLALLVKLGAVGHLAPADPVRSQSAHGKFEEEDGDHGWKTVEVEIRRAIGLRCNEGRRGQYAEELVRALRGLEEAR